MTQNARPSRAVLHDPLDEGPRIAWGTAVLVFLEVAIATPLVVLFFMGALDFLPFFAPLLVFLLLRIPGDVARAIAATRPAGLAIEGPAKAIAWASVPFGMSFLFTGDAGSSPLWLSGTAATLLALALWGHHARALQHAPRVARAEGTAGALLAPFALAAASTFLTPGAPWNMLVPAMILIIGGALAARAIMRLHRQDPHGEALHGWTGWYRTHFFRLSVLVAAVIVYIFIRDTLSGIVPFLFLFEYSFAVFVAAGILWSLRAYARKRSVDGVPLGPHRRHEQAVERQGEARFDLAEAAFGRYLESGDSSDVHALARRLEEEGIPAAEALKEVLTHPPERGVLLVHPGWLYAARLFVVVFFAWIAASVLPESVASMTALLFLAGGLYTTQWNRFGGPWSLKTGLGLGGLALFLAFLSSNMSVSFLQTLPGAILLSALLGLTFVHPLRAKRGRPFPRFLYQGTEPLDAVRPLIQRYDRTIVVRAAWLAAIGIVVFILVGELSRMVPEASLLFTLYLTLAVALITYPILVTVGLRAGRNQALRRHASARQRRESALKHGLARLGDAMVTKKTPRHRTRSGRYAAKETGPAAHAAGRQREVNDQW